MMTEPTTDREIEGVAFGKALSFGLLFGVIIPCGAILGLTWLFKMCKGH
jgi:hypothetical protein